jgi:hypothetical protein
MSRKIMSRYSNESTKKVWRIYRNGERTCYTPPGYPNVAVISEFSSREQAEAALEMVKAQDADLMNKGWFSTVPIYQVC